MPPRQRSAEPIRQPSSTFRVPEDPDFEDWNAWYTDHGGKVCDYSYSGNADAGRVGCHLLIDDPAAVLLDTFRHPNHFCQTVLRESVVRWIATLPAACHLIYGSLTPFPIGWQSIQEEIARHRQTERETWEILERAADQRVPDARISPGMDAAYVTDGREFAALALRLPLDSGILEFFGTAVEDTVVRGGLRLPQASQHPLGVVSIEGMGTPDRIATAWAYGTLLVRYRSNPITTAIPTKLIASYEKAMHRIWNPLIGQRVPGQGGRKGSGQWRDRAHFLSVVQPVVETLRAQHKNPTAARVRRMLATRLNPVDSGTWTNWHKSLGWPTWADVLNYIEGNPIPTA